MTPQYWPPPGVVQAKGMQLAGTQTLAFCAAPHVPPLGQVPHDSIAPQPSPMSPQKRNPMASQVSGLQLLSTHRLFLQVLPAGHPMQSSDRPHPSPMTLQYVPRLPDPPSSAGMSHVYGLQLGPPTHTFFSQVQSAPSGAQSPHFRMPLQLSPMSPQYRPPVTSQVMRHGRPPSTVPLSGPGGSPPTPAEPPVGAMVPPVPPEAPEPPAPPAAPAPPPALPLVPWLPASPRVGTSDEQLMETTKTAAHSQATPKH